MMSGQMAQLVTEDSGQFIFAFHECHEFARNVNSAASQTEGRLLRLVIQDELILHRALRQMLNKPVADALQVGRDVRIVDYAKQLLQLLGFYFAEVHFLLRVENIGSAANRQRRRWTGLLGMNGGSQQKQERTKCN